MVRHSDYYLIQTSLIAELDKQKYKTHSRPIMRLSEPEYSFSEPSITVQTDSKAPLVIYDIEIEDKVTDRIIRKWIRHSSTCRFIYLIVPQAMKEMADSICAKELVNYLVVPFRFVKSGSNRTVEFKFPFFCLINLCIP